MGIISWIVIGGLAGWVASMIMGRDASMGIIGNIVVGVIGAFIGGYVFSLLGGTGLAGFSIWSFIVATAGSVLLLFIVGLVRR